MALEFLNGDTFKQILNAGAINLKAHSTIVNDLNVFPVADGDTGINMYMTITGGVNAIAENTQGGIGNIADCCASGMLMGARGNSGVILSQICYGIAEGLKGVEIANITNLATAFRQGVKRAYEAVVEPTEGTILTVLRESVECTNSMLPQIRSIEEYFDILTKQMRVSLERTPELLPVLKQAGVVDSGGKGLVYIMEGVCKSLSGDFKEDLENSEVHTGNVKTLDFDKFTEDSVMKFGYCTECILRLQRAKTDIDSFNIDEFRSELEKLGDSIVAFKTGSIVKVHIHTMTPEIPLAFCHKFGEFLTLKIENMTLQHNESVFAENEEKVVNREKYALVTVATGKGICETFKQLGANEVIYGGQTNNPSTEDFIKAFDKVNADNIFVLPNNSNIILTAKQAGELYKKSNVYVIETKNIGEGYAVLTMLSYEPDDVEKIIKSFKDSMLGVQTGMVSKAVRDATFDNIKISKDAYVGYENKKMLASSESKVDTACELLDKLGIKEREFLIAIYGKDATEDERKEFKEKLLKLCPTVEMYEINGEQDIYDFLLILQ